MAPSIGITEGGIYTLFASDGYCTTTDTIMIQEWADTHQDTLLSIPAEVELCSDEFPYTLSPISAYTDTFQLNGQPPDVSPFIISSPGLYTLSTQIGECTITVTSRIAELDCENTVYLPNAFSPNNDGFNDIIEPQGKNFAGIRLQVFDRWGGLIAQRTSSPFRWDGENAPPGVYVLIFDYYDLHNNEVTQQVQDILLIR